MFFGLLMSYNGTIKRNEGGETYRMFTEEERNIKNGGTDMSTYLNIARWAKQAGRQIRLTDCNGIGFTGLVEYFFEERDNTEPGCGICMTSDGWAGRYFNESDIASIEVA